MKIQIAVGLVVAATLALGATTASAVNTPVSPAKGLSSVAKVACVGHLRKYDSFTHCMKFSRNNSKYCNKICS
jgi:hypothetical protein